MMLNKLRWNKLRWSMLTKLQLMIEERDKKPYKTIFKKADGLRQHEMTLARLIEESLMLSLGIKYWRSAIKESVNDWRIIAYLGQTRKKCFKVSGKSKHESQNGDTLRLCLKEKQLSGQ